MRALIMQDSTSTTAKDKNPNTTSWFSLPSWLSTPGDTYDKNKDTVVTVGWFISALVGAVTVVASIRDPKGFIARNKLNISGAVFGTGLSVSLINWGIALGENKQKKINSEINSEKDKQINVLQIENTNQKKEILEIKASSDSYQSITTRLLQSNRELYNANRVLEHTLDHPPSTFNSPISNPVNLRRNNFESNKGPNFSN